LKSANEQALESVTQSVATGRGDADYRASLAAIQRAIVDFKGCDAAEMQELGGDLAELGRMAEKLEAGRVDIAVFGEISTGKSALINALCGDSRASVDVRGGWTKDVWHVPWASAGYIIPGLADSAVVLVDTPGLNEVNGAKRAELAQAAASRADPSCSSSIPTSTTPSIGRSWSSPRVTSRSSLSSTR
jgi:predicted GTPase